MWAGDAGAYEYFSSRSLIFRELRANAPSHVTVASSVVLRGMVRITNAGFQELSRCTKQTCHALRGLQQEGVKLLEDFIYEFPNQSNRFVLADDGFEELCTGEQSHFIWVLRHMSGGYASNESRSSCQKVPKWHSSSAETEKIGDGTLSKFWSIPPVSDQTTIFEKLHRWYWFEPKRSQEIKNQNKDSEVDDPEISTALNLVHTRRTIARVVAEWIGTST
ncbi:hypothetical protein C8R45DRAFT_938568 [Mycena sanguinolenta]|nr:hypothetical protein C8R45DRAFT_938568 [Mycena sanguinolenta]